MKNLTSFLSLFALLWVTLSLTHAIAEAKQSETQTKEQDKILGIYFAEDGRSKVKVYKIKEGLYEGKIIWLKEPFDEHGKPRTDIENKDKSKRKRALLNLVVFEKVVYKKPNTWQCSAYSVTRGKTYNKVAMTFKGELLTLAVRISPYVPITIKKKFTRIPEESL